MSYHPGRGLSFASRDHTGRRRYVVPCKYCQSVATVTTPRGDRLCELHEQVGRVSSLAVAFLLFACVAGALGFFAVGYLHDETRTMLGSAAFGFAAAWGGAVAWNEARR